MENEVTKTFENMIGKKPPKEQTEAKLAGYMEAYRTAIPGGHEVTFAKMHIGMVNGKRVIVFMLDKMPPKNLISESFTPTDTTFESVTNKALIHGTYGVADGRKFFCTESQPKPRAKK